MECQIETMEILRQAYQAGRPLKYVFFWGHTQEGDRVTKACLSQWYPSQFTEDGVCYQWAEQYMMAQKALLFEDRQCYEKILLADSPALCQKLGRQIQPFDGALWDKHKSRIVVQGNLAKFSQNQALKEFLLTTGNRILVEASPKDRIWGIGLAEKDPNIENPLLWPGQNLLGFALMQVRRQLQTGEFA